MTLGEGLRRVSSGSRFLLAVGGFCGCPCGLGWTGRECDQSEGSTCDIFRMVQAERLGQSAQGADRQVTNKLCGQIAALPGASALSKATPRSAIPLRLIMQPP
jgi:hypothetical protein